ncbi:hypothetical protein J6590_094985, partial [Homalodisca vitripennis]
RYSTRLIIEKQCNATDRIEPALCQVQRSTIERERKRQSERDGGRDRGREW